MKINIKNKNLKGKYVSEKKLKVAMGINIVIFIILVSMAFYTVIIKDYKSLGSIIAVGLIVILNFYRISLRIKSNKSSRKNKF